MFVQAAYDSEHVQRHFSILIKRFTALALIGLVLTWVTGVLGMNVNIPGAIVRFVLYRSVSSSPDMVYLVIVVFYCLSVLCS